MKLSRRKFLYLAGGGAGMLAAPGIGGLMAGHKGVEVGGEREESLWTIEAPPIPPAPRLESDRKVDLAIIGGGYTGLSCAYYAKKFMPDWSVIVLESHRIGSGASSRNSGFVTEKYEGSDRSDMTLRGLERLVRFIEEEEIECDLAPTALTHLYPSKRSAEKARASMEKGEWIPADELRRGMDTSFYSGAVAPGSYSSVHPGKLVAGHAKAARRVGAELYEHSPVLKVKEGKPAELITQAAVVKTDHVLIATNPHTPRLGFFRSLIVPIHHYSFATRKLTDKEIQDLGLDRWPLRFEMRALPLSTNLTPSGHFFIRIVLGYASFDSCEWRDLEGARKLARKLFVERYPQVADMEMVRGWHGVTAHTMKPRVIACPIAGDNIHASVAYNATGVMPCHNNGYLTACRITGREDKDTSYLAGTKGHYPLPGEFYKSLMFKPYMKLMT